MIDQLQTIFSADRVFTDPESLNTYGRDWTKHIEVNALAVVMPKTTEEVQQLVLWANKNHVGLVPSGGRTGLSGAAFAIQHEVVVSFEKMNKILNFDSVDQTVHCQPGVITETLQNFALEKGLIYPVDFAARGSSHIGGNIATNAGGIKVIRYGLTRNWVTGLKVVTGSGEILNLNNNLIKNATGLDLRHLFIGSEGILGFITECTLKLTRPTKNPQVFLLGVPELSGVMEVFKTYTQARDILAFEMFTEIALQYVLKSTNLKRPFETPTNYYVLIELDVESEKDQDEANSLFETCFENGWVEDGAVSQSPTQYKEFWRLREDISEATSAYEPYKNDISVRVSRVPEFLEEMDAILKKEYPTYDVVWFGHIGDGNLHINILKPKDVSRDEFMNNCKSVNEHLFGMIKKFEGSVSAEHGVGLTKKPYLNITRSEAEIEIMRGLKKVFDPNGIMNPGKVI
ncbi:MAG: FAD-binding oxidoreductase [Bdellovibrionales bacterium]